MSKYIDDIIRSIEHDPNEWSPLGSDGSYWATGGACNDGLINRSMKIRAQRHRVIVDEVAIPSTFIDRIKLRRAIKTWYRTQSIYRMIK